ncbi:hypothetical protein J5U22_01624 [Saccharolobus shibatae]|uniref:Uncharacterized protein n=1 Tax=Saccharolobus shibatae TaxID=2286 RepID=A0A8F5C0U0_9CREN|nr:hypothetical protein J5U22_01624 [Saccharolobus shibatae]
MLISAINYILNCFSLEHTRIDLLSKKLIAGLSSVLRGRNLTIYTEPPQDMSNRMKSLVNLLRSELEEGSFDN